MGACVVVWWLLGGWSTVLQWLERFPLPSIDHMARCRGVSQREMNIVADDSNQLASAKQGTYFVYHPMFGSIGCSSNRMS